MKQILNATGVALLIATVGFVTLAPSILARGHSSGHGSINQGPGRGADVDNPNRGHGGNRGPGNGNNGGITPTPSPGGTPDDHGRHGAGHP